MRSLGYVLTLEVPRRVTEIAMRDLKTDQLLRGFTFGSNEARAHRHLVRRLLHYGATLEEAASAVFHADCQHRLERAMEIGFDVSQEQDRAA